MGIETKDYESIQRKNNEILNTPAMQSWLSILPSIVNIPEKWFKFPHVVQVTSDSVHMVLWHIHVTVPNAIYREIFRYSIKRSGKNIASVKDKKIHSYLSSDLTESEEPLVDVDSIDEQIQDIEPIAIIHPSWPIAINKMWAFVRWLDSRKRRVEKKPK